MLFENTGIKAHEVTVLDIRKRVLSAAYSGDLQWCSIPILLGRPKTNSSHFWKWKLKQK